MNVCQRNSCDSHSSSGREDWEGVAGGRASRKDGDGTRSRRGGKDNGGLTRMRCDRLKVAKAMLVASREGAVMEKNGATNWKERLASGYQSFAPRQYNLRR